MRGFMPGRPWLVGFLVLSVLGVAAPGQGSLSTPLFGGQGVNGSFFDVSSPTGVVITDLEVHLSFGVADFEIWIVSSGGSYVGKECDMSQWTLAASVTGVAAAGSFVATPLNANLGIVVPAGQVQGIYVVRPDFNQFLASAGTAVGNVVVQNADLAIHEGHNAGVYFGLCAGPSAFNGVIHYQPFTATNDLALKRLVAPIDSGACIALTDDEPVSIEVRNEGVNTLPAGTMITMSYDIDGSNPVSEMQPLPQALATFDTAILTFAQGANVQAVATYTFNTSVSLAGDPNAANDALSSPVTNGGQAPIDTFPWSEDFDGYGATPGGTTPPPGWTQDPSDASGAFNDWRFDNQPINIFLAPPADHTTGQSGSGFFAYVDDSGNHAGVNLLTPCLDFTALANPAMKFWLYSHNNNATSTDNTITVDVVAAPGDVVTTEVLTPVGPTGQAWVEQSVDLSAFAGQIVRLRFRASSNGGFFQHDIAIDDILVFDSNPGNGQPPQPGLAVMDINGAFEGGQGAGVGSGLPGPYFAPVTAGDAILMSFSGTPNQAIVVVIGPLSPAIAVLPMGIGQLDIGNAPLVGGLPSGIQVFFDGTQVGFPDAFFVTNANGTMTYQVFAPPAPGLLITFQAAIFNGLSSVISLSNAVQLEVLP